MWLIFGNGNYVIFNPLINIILFQLKFKNWKYLYQII